MLLNFRLIEQLLEGLIAGCFRQATISNDVDELRGPQSTLQCLILGLWLILLGEAPFYSEPKGSRLPYQKHQFQHLIYKLDISKAPLNQSFTFISSHVGLCCDLKQESCDL